METSYTDAQYENNYPDGIEDFYWTKARNKIIYSEIKKQPSIRNSAIIEIGCGRGVVTKYLHERGINCFGIELAPALPIKNAESFIITGKDALEMDAEFTAKFETIMLLDVIEHIEKPANFINQLLEKYKNVKQIVITVPARQEIWSAYDVFFGHFIRYNRPMLMELMKEVKYNIVTNNYAFHLLYFPAYLAAKFLKTREVQVKVPKGVMKYFHSLMANCFYSEYVLLPKKLSGTSVICIAIKK
ncbi:MAG TPA: methyltransferase domain-containing protein [Bacteroidia bacterium]|jgi:2-polyprenyl-3-methyl-5-hydroxy-6-metoxy-1,4-benzoquinol methylase|nr:methyltransferase domain-containing protein [Bacteroidia bacterium]